MGYQVPADVPISATWQDHKNRNPPSSEPGTDYATGYGTPVACAEAGTVSHVDTNSGGGEGRCVGVNLDDGRYVRYLHMDTIGVSNGQRVGRGQSLGNSGASGYNDNWYYGPHVHVSLWDRPGMAYNQTIDFQSCVGGGGGGSAALQPTQRRVLSSAPANGRSDPSTANAATQSLPPGTVANMDGWVHGQDVSGNDMWFHGAISGDWFWSGGFDGGADPTNLTDLNAPTMTPTQRYAATAVNGRAEPNTSSAILTVLAAGTAGEFDGWINGQSVEGEARWLRGALSGAFFSLKYLAASEHRRPRRPERPGEQHQPDGWARRCEPPHRPVHDVSGDRLGEAQRDDRDERLGARRERAGHRHLVPGGIVGAVGVGRRLHREDLGGTGRDHGDPGAAERRQPTRTAGVSAGAPRVHHRARGAARLRRRHRRAHEPRVLRRRRDDAGHRPGDHPPHGHDERSAGLLSYRNDRSSCPTWYVRPNGDRIELIRPGAKPASTGPDWNCRSVAWEVLDECGAPDWLIPEPARRSVAEDIAWLAEFDGKELDGVPVSFKIDAEHIIGHNQALPGQTECPGPDMNVPGIIAMAQEIWLENHPAGLARLLGSCTGCDGDRGCRMTSWSSGRASRSRRTRTSEPSWKGDDAMRDRNVAEEPLHLHIHIDAHITGGPPMDYDVEIPIPETYDAADVRALTARELEDAAFALNLREFGRAPARGALVAAAARIRAVSDALAADAARRGLPRAPGAPAGHPRGVQRGHHRRLGRGPGLTGPRRVSAAHPEPPASLWLMPADASAHGSAIPWAVDS